MSETPPIAARPEADAVKKSDHLKPPVAVLVKLASIAAHVDEALSSDGHPFARLAVTALLQDPDVLAWLSAMNAMPLLPVKLRGTR